MSLVTKPRLDPVFIFKRTCFVTLCSRENIESTRAAGPATGPRRACQTFSKHGTSRWRTFVRNERSLLSSSSPFQVVSLRYVAEENGGNSSKRAFRCVRLISGICIATFEKEITRRFDLSRDRSVLIIASDTTSLSRLSFLHPTGK